MSREIEKRKSANKNFSALRYHCQLLRYVTFTEDQKSTKTKEVMDAKSKVLPLQSNGTWEFSHCSRTSIAQICQAGLEFSVLSDVIPASTDVRFIFGDKIAVDLIHDFISYISQVVGTPQGDTFHIAGAMFSLGRLHAFI